jgi:hypothetical protein
MDEYLNIDSRLIFQTISDTTAKFGKQPQTDAAGLFRAKPHPPGKLVFS